MAPKKKEVQKFTLGEFLEPTYGGGSWADEVEDTYGTQPLPPSERRSAAPTGYSSGGYASIRDNLPQKLPERPPYTAHLGNLSYEATVESVTDFFTGCNPVSVRIIEDREQNRPKGFAYAEFGDLEGLKKALTLDGQSFEGRSIRIKIADPPKDRFDRPESTRDFSDWTRKGPLTDLPPRGGDRRGSGPEFERRGPREPGFGGDDGKVRDFGNWERRGPLSPLPQSEAPAGARDTSRTRTLDSRSESFRDRRESPAWGPGEARQDSRPPRREFSDRPERAVTAADKDMQWRTSMRPDSAAKSSGQSREGSEAPSSPAATPAMPAGRPKLNLTKRTVSEAPDVTSPALSTSDSKASPFGAARPIDTAAREREIEEKRVAAIKAKKEADEKAKEDRRLAKEAAEKEAAEREAAEKEAAEKAAVEKEAAEKKAAEEKAAEEEIAKERESAAAAAAAAVAAATAVENEATEAAAKSPETTGATPSQADEQKVPARSKEPREGAPAAKSRAAESGNWRQQVGEQRGGSRGGHVPSGPRRGGAPRGPRGDAAPRPSRANGGGSAAGRQAQPAASDPDSAAPTEDGWTVVPNKNRRGNARAGFAS